MGWLVGVPVPDNPQPASQRKSEISQGHKNDWPTSSFLLAPVA